MQRAGLSADRRLRFSLAVMLAVFVGGTAGYMAFGYNLLDAVFQTVTTITTVGFGEVHPFTDGV